MATSVAMAAVTAGAVTGCSVPTQELPRAGTCDPFQLTEVSPTPGSRGVPKDATLTATFSDFPDPDTITPANLVLYTGFYFHTGRFWVDLVERRALFKTSGDLRAGLGYTFVVKPAIRSLRGCRLEPPPPAADGDKAPDLFDFRFEVVADSAEHFPTPLPPSPPTYQQVLSVFGGHCAGSACHLARPSAPGDALALAMADPLAPPPVDNPAAARCLAAPGGGLSLCERDARKALVGIPSRQVSPLVLVASRDGSRSYLLRKIVGAPPIVGHSGVPDDSLNQDEKHVIQDWIDTGAPGPLSPTQAGDGGI